MIAIARVKLLLTILMLFCGTVYAGGLMTRLGEVWLDNVRCGQEFSMRDSLNMPLKIKNTSAMPIELRMEVYLNRQGDTDIKQGYEILPDASWIKLEKYYFPKVEPNMEVETDIIIEIPKDKTYLGKKYQFYVWARSISGLNNINVGVKSRFLITIISAENLAVLEGRKKPDKIRANLDFSMLPYEIFVKRLELGKTNDLESVAGGPIKIVNPNASKMKFKIYSLTTKEANTFLKRGYEDFPDKSFVILKEKEIKVEPESIKRIKAFLRFPKKDEYKDKRYQCIIVLESIGQDVNAKVYSRLYVTTQE